MRRKNFIGDSIIAERADEYVVEEEEEGPIA
jgi:hypothetical protein